MEFLHSYQCRNFSLDELVWPEIYQDYIARPDLLWQKFDPWQLKAIDDLRDNFDCPVIINNWKIGKIKCLGNQFLRFCGARPFNCPEGAELSDHKFWRGFDLHFRDVSAQIVRQHILQNQEKYSRGINVLEDRVTWVHIGKRNWDVDQYGILLVKC